MAPIPDNMVEPTFGLSFDEPTHTYMYNGEVMKSVTTLVKQLSKPFDAVYHSERMAAKEGSTETAEEIRDKWTKKSEEACLRGDYIHAMAEAIAWELQTTSSFCIPAAIAWELQTSFCIPAATMADACGRLRGLYAWYIHHIEVAQGFLCPELKVVWPEKRIAGTVDLVASNYEGVPAIIDWKQNEKIQHTGYRNMLPPFQRGKLKLEDANFWSYALQLNLYRRILMERYGYEAERLILVHLPGRGYVEYDVPIMSDRVDKLLEEVLP